MSDIVLLRGFGGSGGSGATLTVTAPAGCTVTVSKDGKSKTKVADASGVAVFKGLATGDWVLCSTDGVQIFASQKVTITADYAADLRVYATINVTYPAGSTCTATDGVTTLTAPDTSGTWACAVPNAGTWTVRIADGERTKEVDVSITTEGQNKSIEIDYRTYWFKGSSLNANLGLTNAGARCGIINSGLALGTVYDSASGSGSGGGRSVNKIDVTQFDKFCFTVLSTNGSLYGGVCYSTDVDPGTKITASAVANTSGTYTVDLSAMSGEYYVALSFGQLTVPIAGLVSAAWFE